MKLYKQYSPLNLESALEAIRSGQMLLQEASTAYGVPKGTLMNRIYSKKKSSGQPDVPQNYVGPKCPTTTKRKRYSKWDVENAIEAVSFQGLSVRRASKIFGVPKSTLDRKMVEARTRKALVYEGAYA